MQRMAHPEGEVATAKGSYTPSLYKAFIPLYIIMHYNTVLCIHVRARVRVCVRACMRMCHH